MQDIPEDSPDRLLPRQEVEYLTRKRKSAIYAGMKDGSFPLCVKLGPRSVAWSEREIQAWIAAKIRAPRRGSK